MTTKIKFIIMTTSIIRPNLHNTSIKLFYDKYYLEYKSAIDQYFSIYHIINIDAPELLKKEFTVEETVNNFNQIIPDNINRFYITTEQPSFPKAFKNIMNKISELDLIDTNNIYFWFEDDWTLTININFFEIVKQLLRFKCCAMTMTQNCQLGSFRGGPIMNGTFFNKYFNLVKMDLYSDKCDPERQYCRWVGKYYNHTRYKFSDAEKKVKLIQVNLKGIGKYMDDFGMNLYQQKFNKKIEFEKYIVVLNNELHNNELETRLKSCLYLNCTNNNNEFMKTVRNYQPIKFDHLIEQLDSESIVYLIVKPFTFVDCGREFTKNYDLFKWT